MNLFDRMTYRVPLWAGRSQAFMSVLELPLDLRPADVTRIKAFLDTIVKDERPPGDPDPQETP
jgi:hypothetical protein